MSKRLSARKASSRIAKLAAVGALTLGLAAAVSPSAQAATLTAAGPNGIKHNVLTISNGTRYVVINGVTVDFGTPVRDLAWSPDGNRAVFIDGSGDLVLSNANGSGRVVVAKNPGGQTWSHPTWQKVSAYGKWLPERNNIIFAARKNGVSRLETVPAAAVHGKPALLAVMSGPGGTPLPQTGNAWPNANGKFGTTVYANGNDGDVYIHDDYLRVGGGMVTKGSEPTIAPNEEAVVFVRSVHGHDHLFEQGLGGQAAKDLTPNATTDYTEPTWSPDGRTIAARTPKGIVTLPANGSAAPKPVSTHTGLPAYRA